MIIIEGVGNQMLPPPGVDLNNPNAPMALPLPNQLFPLVSRFVAVLVGGWVAIRLSGRAWTAWLIAASVIAGQLLSYMLGRHPGWLMAAGVLAPLAAAWLAQMLAGPALRSSE
jgi:predicted membrane-bound dolichyl-phosphate-mannose-protein mannosyltransferase